MTAKEKHIKRKLNASNRRYKRNQKYFNRIEKAQELGGGIPLSVIRTDGSIDIWVDDDSPTGYSQKCSYEGTCQYPCNGDC